ncbi:heterokaryon incompatibility protein [Rutstroemia sp. NJR-2017a WRK4]|nr:heterokaryon incompatibility protein [Rutstroemia sp. NJR-2017a WRK4]
MPQNKFRAQCKPGGGFGENPWQNHTIEYITTLSRIEKAAAAGCNWCSMILLTASSDDDLYGSFAPSLQAGELRIELSTLNPPFPYTPVGHNLARIMINSKSADATIFTDDESIIGDIVTARHLDTQVNSLRAYQQIRTWLRECVQHKKCGPVQPSLLPTRVIEVSPGEHPEYPRLYAAKGAVGYYAALSYCWGADQKGLTTLHNLDSRFQHLDTSALSQTIQDAITCTKNMGMKYLWINALCIIQDSVDDKVFELASMGRIYQNASIAIVAASASSANQGFLEDREPPKPSFQIPFWAPGGRLSSVSMRQNDDYEHNDEPINQRAWTLQEQLLSSRLLIYSSHTLQYHCQEHTVILGNSINIVPSVDSSLKVLTETIPWQFRRSNSILDNPNFQDVGRAWAQIVGIYSKRKLSYVEDRLPALGGVDIISFDIVLENQALPFGRVKYGFLKLKAFVRRGYFDARRSFNWYPLASHTDNAASDAEIDQTIVKLDDSTSEERDVLCLAIARRDIKGDQDIVVVEIDGLLISPLLPPVGAQGEYRRVGRFCYMLEKHFKGFTREIITLV